MKAIKAIFGSVMMLRIFCENCGSEAFVIDGKMACCGKPVDLEEVKQAKRKRESISSDRHGKPPRSVQKEILKHQLYQCIYCGVGLRGKRIINFDHFIPFSYLGSGNKNFVASCEDCNKIKSSMLFDSIIEAQVYIQAEREKKTLKNCLYCGGSYDVRKL